MLGNALRRPFIVKCFRTRTMSIRYLIASLILISSSCANDIGIDAEHSTGHDDEAFRQSSMAFLKSATSLAKTFDAVEITEDGIGTDGRGSKLTRLAIPLIIGFKIASLITASIGVLKAFVVKTVLISGLSLLVSVALAAKFIVDKLARSGRYSEATSFYYGHPHSAPSEPIPAWEHPAAVSHENSADGKWSQVISGAQASESNNNLSNTPPLVSAAQRKTILKPNAYKISMYKTTVKEVSRKK